MDRSKKPKGKEQETVQMTNQETSFFLEQLKKLNNLKGFDLTMAIADVREHLEREHRILNEKVKFSEDYEKIYQEELRETHKEFSFKDAAGNPKTIQQPHPSGRGTVTVFDLDPELEDDMVLAIDKVKKKHKVLIDEQEAKEKEYQEAMKENTTLKKIKFPEKMLPQKEIEAEQMYILRKFLILHKGNR